MNQLRATQTQLEELAVERERVRVARGIHDILGHSLTVVTVRRSWRVGSSTPIRRAPSTRLTRSRRSRAARSRTCARRWQASAE